MKSHYNTTGENGQLLMDFNAKAERQEDAILRHMKRQKMCGPSQMWRLVSGVWPIGSIRRAMTNLSKEGHLTKTNDKIEGLYGRPEHVWKIAESQETVSYPNNP